VILELDNFSLSSDTILGDMLVIIMVIFYSIYLVFTKKLADGMSTYTLSFWMFAFGGLTCLVPLPFMLFFDLALITPTYTIPATGWVSIFIVCFIGTTLTYLCTNWALENTSPLVVAVYAPMELVSTVVMGLFVLEFELVWQQGLGAALIVSGLLCVVYAKFREKAEEGKDDVEIEVGQQGKEKGLLE